MAEINRLDSFGAKIFLTLPLGLFFEVDI